MIRINRILPLGSSGVKIPIRKIRNEYFEKLNEKGRRKINRILENAIASRSLFNSGITQIQVDLMQYLVNNYKNILIGDVNILEKTKREIENNGWQGLVFENNRISPFGKKLLTAFGYTNRFRSDQNRGIWLAKQLNIKSCPYCNAQYTLTIQSKDKDSLAKFQFDHFFSKERYPYFSVSLYNLIPSCASCNHKKSNKIFSLERNYHPYYNSIAAFSKFKLEYPSSLEKLSFDCLK